MTVPPPHYLLSLAPIVASLNWLCANCSNQRPCWFHHGCPLPPWLIWLCQLTLHYFCVTRSSFFSSVDGCGCPPLSLSPSLIFLLVFKNLFLHCNKYCSYFSFSTHDIFYHRSISYCVAPFILEQNSLHVFWHWLCLIFFEFFSWLHCIFDKKTSVLYCLGDTG